LSAKTETRQLSPASGSTISADAVSATTISDGSSASSAAAKSSSSPSAWTVAAPVETSAATIAMALGS